MLLRLGDMEARALVFCHRLAFAGQLDACAGVRAERGQDYCPERGDIYLLLRLLQFRFVVVE